jgi:REP element-mobilizing transposase RayT
MDVFLRRNHKIALVESLKFCQQNKGLEIFAWCLMPSHLHMIVRAAEGNELAPIIRDFKRHTSTQIISQIQHEPESRREWMLQNFERAARDHPKGGKYKFWQDGYHPVELYSPAFTRQKLNYIHQNPVVDMLVQQPWDYWFSSARNYAGMDGLLEVIKIEF